MKKLIALLFLLPLVGIAQTVTLFDATVISNTSRAGLNSDQPSPGFPDNKNYFVGGVGAEDPGFEPPLQKQIWGHQNSPAQVSSHTMGESSYQNVIYNGYVLNQWQNASFLVAQGCYGTTGGGTPDPNCTSTGGTTDPAFGCSGTLNNAYDFVDPTYTATVSGGAVTGITVSGGSTFPPNMTSPSVAPGVVYLTISGGGGSGASFYITTNSSGVPNSTATLVSGGTGYTSPPSVSDPIGKPIYVVNPATNQGSSGCAGPLGLAGQVLIVSTTNNSPNVFPTSQLWWTNNGWSVSGGATVVSETTDLCATCGTQSMLITVPSGGSVGAGLGPNLSTGAEKSYTFIAGNTYTISYWAKSVSGSPNISTAIVPRPPGGSTCNDSFNPTTTWALHSFTCTFSETTASQIGNLLTNFTFNSNSGTSVVEFDNISFTNSADTNPTNYSNAYIKALQDWCQSTQNTTGPACTIRFGGHPDSETMANWVQPVFSHQPTIESQDGFTTSFFTMRDPLGPWLQSVSYIGGIPVIIFPSTITTSGSGTSDGTRDIEDMLDYLQGSSSTTFGAIRAGQGQTGPWVCASGCPFSQVYLEFGNENWNGGFIGHIWGFNNAAPQMVGYWDYSTRAAVLFTAARNYQTSKGYSQAVTSWVLNYQTADGGGNLWFGSGATQGMLQVANPDGVEFNGYTAYNIDDTNSTCTSQTNCPLYAPTLTEPWSNINDPNSASGFFQTMLKLNQHPLCGASHASYCFALVYEQNTGTFNGSTGYNFGQYINGGSCTGSGSANLSNFNGAGATGVTATVNVTGGVIDNSTQYNRFNWTNAGTPTGPSTTATLSNGSGTTCSGTANIYAPLPFNQLVATSFTSAGFQGIVYAEQILQEDQAQINFPNIPIASHNAFEINQFYFGEGGVALNMWGVAIGEGDDCSITNSSLFGGVYCPRPQMLAAELYNACKIGPLVQTLWSSGPTYNLATNNNSVNAINSVPFLTSAAFKSGAQRCIAIVNKDVVNAHTVTFAGANAPTTNVSVATLAPTHLYDTNEAGGLTDTRTYTSLVKTTTTPSVNVTGGYTLPAHSFVTFTYLSGALGPTGVQRIGHVTMNGSVTVQ